MTVDVFYNVWNVFLGRATFFNKLVVRPPPKPPISSEKAVSHRVVLSQSALLTAANVHALLLSALITKALF